MMLLPVAASSFADQSRDRMNSSVPWLVAKNLIEGHCCHVFTSAQLSVGLGCFAVRKTPAGSMPDLSSGVPRALESGIQLLDVQFVRCI